MLYDSRDMDGYYSKTVQLNIRCSMWTRTQRIPGTIQPNVSCNRMCKTVLYITSQRNWGLEGRRIGAIVKNSTVTHRNYFAGVQTEMCKTL